MEWGKIDITGVMDAPTGGYRWTTFKVSIIASRDCNITQIRISMKGRGDRPYSKSEHVILEPNSAYVTYETLLKEFREKAIIR